MCVICKYFKSLMLGLDCELDIQRTTHMVRSFRPGLVQSEAQYQFIYSAINHYVQTICSRISAGKVSTFKCVCVCARIINTNFYF